MYDLLTKHIRKAQWNKILDYLDSIENKENLCITGDFNHGVKDIGRIKHVDFLIIRCSLNHLRRKISRWHLLME